MTPTNKQGKKEALLTNLLSGHITVPELLELKAIMLKEGQARHINALTSALIVARIDVLLFDHKMLTDSVTKIKRGGKTKSL